MDGISKTSKTSKNSKHFIHFKTFENEDHTLGGLLHHELLQNVDTLEMAGYQTPNPQAKMIELKLVTKDPCTTQEADMIVKKALRDLLIKVETMETNYQDALYKFENKLSVFL
jgi:DNA-directed RNA polymerase subunit L